MKIILLKSYENLGKVGEIVNVKPGFARNYLIPNKIASLATEQNIKALEVFLKSQENKEAKNRINLEVLSKKLNSLTLKFDVQVGEDEKLFGSVTSQMIADELADKGYTVDKKEIVLEETIKELGNFKIAINLGYDLDTKIKVKVQAAK
ncbi:MAG: 50S ribosomal protein L9 [Candidatus Marinimicrobia bacterium]|nr:50S ribosomal protein L9 [Candidatus Neomarinimicrobiota bacterium]|tara:strand:+ start:883 stop:1329 length:447 start_codon:yes stop_codon:yes gene_type:complete